jgi:hypothetical protein
MVVDPLHTIDHPHRIHVPDVTLLTLVVGNSNSSGLHTETKKNAVKVIFWGYFGIRPDSEYDSTLK